MQTVIDTFQTRYRTVAKCQHPRCGYAAISLGMKRDRDRLLREAEAHKHPVEVDYEAIS
jgi:hypothetical protein